MNEAENQRLAELILLLSCGKKDALNEIYAIMSKILYTVGNIYYTQEEDIKDAIQDLMEKLLKYARRFKINENSSASAWILQIYKNQISNHLKRRKREKNFIDTETDKYKTTLFDFDDKYIENHLFVSDIFNQMTDYEQELIIYRYWCKCSLKEMSKILKKPLTTIESQLSVLKDKIKKIK